MTIIIDRADDPLPPTSQRASVMWEPGYPLKVVAITLRRRILATDRINKSPWRMVALPIVFILASDPALACHRYKIWRNPWPQPCPLVGETPRVKARAQIPLNAPAPKEITVPPLGPLTEDEERWVAIKKLSEEMRK